jgi:hypothetical protein
MLDNLLLAESVFPSFFIQSILITAGWDGAGCWKSQMESFDSGEGA